MSGGPAPQQPRLGLAHEAGEQRREQQHQQHLRALNGEIADQDHTASTSSRMTSAQNTSEKLADGQELQAIETVGGEPIPVAIGA